MTKIQQQTIPFEGNTLQLYYGARKFKRRLQVSASKIINYVNREHRHRQYKEKNNRDELQVSTMEMILMEQVAMNTVSLEVEEFDWRDRYGNFPRKNPEDCSRLMLENWNSLGLFTQKKKVSDVNMMIAQYEVYGLGGCEPQADWRFSDVKHKFHKLLMKCKERKIIIWFNYTEEKIARGQRGGMEMIAIGRFSTFVLDRSTDPTNLGRWCLLLLGGPEKKMRLCTASQLCNPGGFTANQTVWDQHS